jgi:hypothetical protein
MPCRARCQNGSRKMKPSSSGSKEGLRPETFPIGSAESRAAARALIAARRRESEIVEISWLGTLGHARYRVDKTGMKLVEGSCLPTREQFEAAYPASHCELFESKSMISGAQSLPRSQGTPQWQSEFEKASESDHLSQKATIDPLAAVHRRR